MLRARFTVLLAGLWLIAACGVCALAAQATHEVVVTAAETGYTETPVWVPIDAAAGMTSAHLTRWNAADGPPPPQQLVRAGDKTWLVFLLRDLKQGEARRYHLTLSDEAEPTAVGGVQVKQGAETVDVTIDDAPFTRYWFASGPKPYCWPVIGPTGQPMTRAFPMAQVAGESSDHVHHRSLWFAHGSVNGVDLWGEGAESGKTVHRAFEALVSGPVVGMLRSRNDWVARDGKKVCEDTREIRVYRVSSGRVFDFEITATATEGPVKFGDTKEGTFGIRLADSMAVIRGKGHIINSAGQTDRDAWGKRGEWCDYSGPVGDKVVGVTIFDHPESFRHPTYWHVRDYGLFAVNPFGIRDYTGLPEGEPGAYTIEKGQSLTFRYRIYMHAGPPDVPALSALYNQYAHPPQVTVR